MHIGSEQATEDCEPTCPVIEGHYMVQPEDVCNCSR